MNENAMSSKLGFEHRLKMKMRMKKQRVPKHLQANNNYDKGKGMKSL